MELNSGHISDLDKLIRIALDSDDEILITSNLTLDPYSLELSKVELYLEVLYDEGLVELGSDSSVYLLKKEKCRIHLENGGFRQLAIDQMKEDERLLKRESVEEELTELQLKQLRLEARQMLFKSWWFWLAAAMVGYSFIRQLISDFN